ncbi:hypothetical protein [Bartonella vinsonii]|uniref:Uncharacterized protein n=1 Tax=Bartonella vinsonii subsp. berkhoffii str. Tweed TaxID=1094502 RepID=N6VKE8_BARVB|nr:hypothetical protein [Bartonella vinsonii]AGF76075.1 hypothetical protein BVwin_09720 [Bartonella vinsonii subsp. berkhoffii str. Winnie]ENN94380.1 hypothetical protein BVtw_11320 [Bartonella vinsonii subsp. berkhoffii str. Tweed]
MGFCWRRILFVLFVFFIFFASLFASRNVAVHKFLFGGSFSSQQVDVTEEILLERLAVLFPDIITQLSKLNSEQQKQLIEEFRRDVISAASANGQSSEQARKLGETVVMVLSKAILHPSIADAYF